MTSSSGESSAHPSETAYLPPGPPPTNHGHTVAAWTTTIVVLAGSTVSAVGVLLAAVWLFWVGLAVVVVGLLVGKVLQMAGYGQGGAKTVARQSSGRSHH